MSNRMSKRMVQATGVWLACVLPAAFAGQSLVLTPGRTGTFTFPSVPAFTAIKAYRIEARLHNFTVPSTPTAIWTLPTSGVITNVGFRPGQICVESWQDGIDYGGRACLDVAGRTDVALRVQRNPDKMWYSFELWDVSTGAYTVRTCGAQGPTCTITKANPVSWAVTGQIGGGSTTARLAWFKLHSSLVALNSRPPLAADAADLADWRFEGSLTDSGPFHVSTSFSNATYVSTPGYAPVCHAGTQRSFRAGAPASLDGSGSYALDDGAGLQYRWQASGPSEVSWDNSNAVSAPTVSGLVFGTYVFELKIQDSSGATGTCTVKHGAVATDDNGVVIFSDENVSKVLSPMIQWGKSPWPWYDERHKALADLFGGLQPADYLDVWNTAREGTITATKGSATITGSGTSLAADFCGGGTSPAENAGIVIWYPTGSGGYGRRLYGIASCQSETQITLSGNYQTSGTTAGLSFSKITEAQLGIWINGSTNVNYYDNVMAFYALYYRSGIDTYRDYARTLADRWWSMPLIDEGRSCNDAWPGGVNCVAPRIKSQAGLILRALDGRPDIWPGLRLWWEIDRAVYLKNPSKIGDIREDAYRLWGVAACAALDPDAAVRADCTSAVISSLDLRWGPQREAAGNWTNQSWWPASWSGYAGSVSVTRGSATVTGVGTEWQSSWFTPDTSFWVANSPSPASNADGDPVVYRATYVSPTEARLDRPYEGSTGTGRGWQVSGLVGYGTAPFMLGIVGQAFEMVHRATGDPRAREWVRGIATWLETYGYRPSTKGMYYARGFVNCEPIAEGKPWCSDQSVEDTRFMSGEVQGEMAYATLDGGASVVSFGDTLHGAIYGKLGGPNTDGAYASELDSWTVSTKKAKNFGFHFGFGAGWAWPAARLGGVAPPAARTRWVPFRPANVPRTSGARLTLTAPDGKTIETKCASSPCSVVEDGRQGDYLLKLEYESPGGKTVAAPSRPVVLKGP